jgi:hypothetical protein
MRDVHFMFRCRCGKVERRTYQEHEHGYLLLDGRGEDISNERCACGRLYQINQIRGRTKPAVVCAAKCMESKGHTCECSCGGKNHGASYAATEALSH